MLDMQMEHLEVQQIIQRQKERKQERVAGDYLAMLNRARQRAATRLRAWASAAARERERGLRRELGASAHLLSEYRRAGGASTLLRRLARWARGMALPRAW